MIDLMLGVYNYLIKPRLQNLQGHRVSSQEWKKDRIQMLTNSRGTTKSKGCLGVCFPLPARAHLRSFSLADVIPPGLGMRK